MPDQFRRTIPQVVVEPLVITGVESLLKKDGFGIPVGFCHEKEMGMFFLNGGNHFFPTIFFGWDDPVCSPGVLKNRIQHQHRHIHTQAIAKVTYFNQCLYHCLPEARMTGIQLNNVLPGRKIGVFPSCENMLPNANISVREFSEVIFCALHEIFGMMLCPGMVRGDVVGDKIQDEFHSARMKRVSCFQNAFFASKTVIYLICLHTVGGANHIRGGVIGQNLLKFLC